MVLVNLIDESETAVRGVLWRSRGPWLVVREASLVKANLAPVAMDGEVLIHRGNVAFIQVLPGAR